MKIGKKNLILILGVILFCVAVFQSCKHEPLGGLADNTPINGGTQPCSTDTVYFQTQVLPIIISNCAMSGCHNAASAQDGVVLTSYATIRNTGGIKPGNPNGSDLYEVLVTNNTSKKMPVPPRTPLTTTQTNLIKKWIEQGAKNNSCSDCDTTGAMLYSTHVQPLLQTNCLGCHSTAAYATSGGGINLGTHTAVKTQVTNGKLLGAINWTTGFKAMPQGGQKLSACKITQIQKWVNAGALNN
jgi:hypothetical protein